MHFARAHTKSFFSDTLKQKGQILNESGLSPPNGIVRWSRYPGNLLKEAAWEAANLSD
jgi:hypothetical protein